MGVRDPLDPDDVAARLAARDGWSGNISGIAKTYTVNYDVAIGIVTEIGQAAIDLEHRPDIDLRWDTLHIAMTTHTAGDVTTELDFLLADRIDDIAARHGAMIG